MKKILVIGTACVDILVDSIDERILNEFSYRSKTNTLAFGGDGLNEAVNTANLGGDVSFITTLGKDDAGKAIFNFCKENNVKIKENCFIDDKTNVSIILIDQNRKRHFISTLDGAMRVLGLDNIELDLKGIDIVSFGSMFISRSLDDKSMSILFKQIKEANKILCADMVSPKNGENAKDMECLKYLDYFLPNDIEALKFTGTNTIEEAADILFESGIKNVIIKCGKKGCYLRNKHTKEYIPCEILDTVIDSTGAGDSFVSGFLYGLSKDMKLIDALKMGHKCAYECIKHIGANSWSKGFKYEI